MDVVYLILYIVAAVCFALAGMRRSAGSVDLIALGLLAVTLVLVIQQAQVVD